MILTIRKAQAEDATFAWDIRNAAIVKGCKGFYPDKLLEEWTSGDMTEEFMQLVDKNLYVACENGRVVGTGMIDRKSGKLDAIFVRPDLMGIGIGKKIMLFLEDIGCTSELKILTLEATLNAAPFYRRCGFAGNTVGVYKSPRGIELDCVLMTKAILPSPSE